MELNNTNLQLVLRVEELGELVQNKFLSCGGVNDIRGDRLVESGGLTNKCCVRQVSREK
jgi:hypothetical protein